MSPLSQGRGLKREVAVRVDELSEVAPFTGAWIETGLC